MRATSQGNNNTSDVSSASKSQRCSSGSRSSHRNTQMNAQELLRNPNFAGPNNANDETSNDFINGNEIEDVGNRASIPPRAASMSNIGSYQASCSSSARPTTTAKIVSNVSFSAHQQQLQLRKQRSLVAKVSPIPITPISRTDAHSTHLHMSSHPHPQPHYDSYVTGSLSSSPSNTDDATFSYSVTCGSQTSKTKRSIHPTLTGWNTVETKGGIAPCQRSLHTTAVLDNSLFIFGGYDGQSRINDFHRYSFTDKTWSPINSVSDLDENVPSPRDRHISVVYQNALFVFGGFDGTSRVNDFFKFDFHTMRWKQIIPSNQNVQSHVPPSPRHSHSAVVFEDSMYIFGGYDGSYRSDLHEYHFPTNTWTLIQPNTRNTNHNSARPPRARYRATCVVHEKSRTMILFGGHDGSRHLSDTHVFHFDTQTWIHFDIEGEPPIPRDSHASVMYQDSMFVFGGSTGSAMNDLFELKINIHSERELIEEDKNSLISAKWCVHIFNMVKSLHVIYFHENVHQTHTCINDAFNIYQEYYDR